MKRSAAVLTRACYATTENTDAGFSGGRGRAERDNRAAEEDWKTDFRDGLIASVKECRPIPLTPPVSHRFFREWRCELFDGRNQKRSRQDVHALLVGCGGRNAR
jgi:hypothetical protein